VAPGTVTVSNSGTETNSGSRAAAGFNAASGATAAGSKAAPAGNASAKSAIGTAATQSKAAAGKSTSSSNTSTLAAQVTLLNKYLNDSGRPDEFRVDPESNNKVIQEINPTNGAVIAEYSASEFAELARSLGISGAVVNSLA
jgi:uncharacterized FlaG/YvyC family protein